MANHSNILAWKSPWSEEPGGLQSMGSQRVKTRLKQLSMSMKLHVLWSYVLFPCVKSLQLCLILCDPMDCSLSGSSVYGILQVRILEWVAISYSTGSFRSRD